MSNSLLSQIIENINNSKFHESEQLAWDLYNQNKTDFNIIKTLALTLLLQNKYNGSIDFYLKAEKINSNLIMFESKLKFSKLNINPFSILNPNRA